MALGKREAAEGTVSIRRLGSKEQTVLPLADALSGLEAESHRESLDARS